MSVKRHNPFAPIGVGVLCLLMGIGALAESAGASIKRMGESSLVYKGPQVQVALGYRYAKSTIGAEWLLLEVEMTATRHTVEVRREKIALRTPSGTVVRLATQEAFTKAYSALRADIAAANVARQPLEYLTPQPPRRLEFFAKPGYRLAYATQWLNPNRNYFGRLYFHVPGGMQKGEYVLLIELADKAVEIPFSL